MQSSSNSSRSGRSLSSDNRLPNFYAPEPLTLEVSKYGLNLIDVRPHPRPPTPQKNRERERATSNTQRHTRCQVALEEEAMAKRRAEAEERECLRT